MRWSKSLQVFAIIIAVALCGSVIAYDHFVTSSLLSSTVKAGDFAKNDFKATVSKAAPTEHCYLKTPGLSSVSARSAARDFSNTLFVSFFDYSKNRTVLKAARRNLDLQFVAIGLKIIYPYHYFW